MSTTAKKSTQIELERIQQRREGIDYANRKRNLEWRRDWFYLDRSENDDELLGVLSAGLETKRRKVEQQRGEQGHLAAYAPAGAGSPWFTIGPRNVNGRIKCLAVDPTDADIVFAGAASGGVWKSADGAQSWRPLWDEQDTMAVGGLAVAPSAPTTIYAATGEWTPG